MRQSRKRNYGPYIVGEAQWVKIRNPVCSQWEGREKLFEREIDPDIYWWDAWEMASEGV